MEKKLRSVLSGTGFYAALAACLLIAGVGGYLLLPRQAEPPAETDPAPAASAGAPAQLPQEPEGPAVSQEALETAAPAPLPEEEQQEPAATVMPEVEIDVEPVVAQEPRLIVNPLRGEVLQAFSVDELVYSPTLEDWRIHDGVDISAKPGTTVMAASPGTVSRVANDPLMGALVVIDHDGGYQTTYANLQDTPAVAEGETVSAGQIIGAVGSTAAAESAQSPHLHFSVTKDGALMDPDDFLNS